MAMTGHTTIENVEILLTSTQNTCHRKISQRKISQKSDLKFTQEINQTMKTVRSELHLECL